MTSQYFELDNDSTDSDEDMCELPVEGGEEPTIPASVDKLPTHSLLSESSEIFSYLQQPPDTQVQTDPYSWSDASFRENDFRCRTARGPRTVDIDPGRSPRSYGRTRPTDNHEIRNENNGRHTP